MRVQLSRTWTDGGVDHRAGSKVNVSRDVARQLIDDGLAQAVGVGHDELPPPPPRAGKGSGVDVWAAYAGDVVVAGRLDAAGQHIGEDASREDIWTALEAAGVPLDIEPAPNSDAEPGAGGSQNEGGGR